MLRRLILALLISTGVAWAQHPDDVPSGVGQDDACAATPHHPAEDEPRRGARHDEYPLGRGRAAAR